jgi:hypothetical protein
MIYGQLHQWVANISNFLDDTTAAYGSTSTRDSSSYTIAYAL